MELIEPKILVVGKSLPTLKVLADEWAKFGRNVEIANTKDAIKKHLGNSKFDFVTIGAGLPDDERKSIKEFIGEISSDLDVNLLERHEDSLPYHHIPFLNNLVVMFKINQANGF